MSEWRAHRQDTDDIELIEADGNGSPMAHSRLTDDSFNRIAPLRTVQSVQEITDPVVAREAFVSLGAYTGQNIAVCAYESVRHPALVAYDLRDGSVSWTSNVNHLPPVYRRRWVSGLLLAKLKPHGAPPERRVFVGNSREFIAYDNTGRLIWRQTAATLLQHAERRIVTPRCIRFSSDKSLVTATRNGWVIKLDPLTGDLIDAYAMRGTVSINGSPYAGSFFSPKSTIVVGNILYLVAEFNPHPANPLGKTECPVYVVRINLAGGGNDGSSRQSIVPLSQSPDEDVPDRIRIGTVESGGSPSALVKSSGATLVFANAYVRLNGHLAPIVVAVEDCRGQLLRRWWSCLRVRQGERLLAAPALHPDSGTLLVGTSSGLHVFRNVDSLAGEVPPPVPVTGVELFDPALQACIGSVFLTSPLALAYDEEADEIVVYTNFLVTTTFDGRGYGFLVALGVPVDCSRRPRFLWTQPLAFTRDRQPAPGPGTFGQPALFETGDGSSGVIVNTSETGTYIFR